MRSSGRGWWGSDATYFSYCEQELTPMTERRNPKFFQVLVCQMGQDSEGNVVLGKALGVLPKADGLKPVRNLLHRARRGFGLDQSPQDFVFILLTRGL
jgi:hypothetical protein